MLGRLYTITFVALIIFAFWFQKRHLDQAAKEFHAQLDSENFNLPTSIIKDFVTRSYSNGKIKYSFSGHKMTYFSDGHFEAEGALVYNGFDNEKVITINTEKALGQMETTDNAPFVPNNSQLKYVFLPDDVYFNLNDNKGKTRQVRFDAILQTIESDQKFESEGPQGHLQGIGFQYAIKNEEFKIKSNVSGGINMQKPPYRNKNLDTK